MKLFANDLGILWNLEGRIPTRLFSSIDILKQTEFKQIAGT